MLNSNSTFDDIKIGDKFKSYTGKIRKITGKNLEDNMEKPNITSMEVETETIGSMPFSHTIPFSHFKDLFVKKLYVPYITTPQSLSSLAANEVKKKLSLQEINNLYVNGYIDKNTYEILIKN